MDRDHKTDWQSPYQPLPLSSAERAFRPLSALLPPGADLDEDEENDEDHYEPLRPPSFRLRRGRGGVLRLDRRNAVLPRRRDTAPAPGIGSGAKYGEWLFPDSLGAKADSNRPKSIDDVQRDRDDLEEEGRAKRRRLNEMWRYDVDSGGAVGVGMGVNGDEERVIIDDLEPK